MKNSNIHEKYDDKYMKTNQYLRHFEYYRIIIYYLAYLSSTVCYIYKNKINIFIKFIYFS